MRTLQERRGAVLPLFAILLPVLIMLCAFAINVAYMQLTTTELRVAADAAARAGGRAWSEEQDLTAARDAAAAAALANTVAGEPLVLSQVDGSGDIEFGISTRVDNGFGRYDFAQVSSADIEDGAEATSIRINARKLNSGSGSVSLLFGGVGSRKTFEPVISSICTQVDRDIALVLDRSGSMVFCADEEALYDAVTDLYYSGDITSSERSAALRDYEGDNGSMSGSVYDREFPPYVLSGLTNAGYSDLHDYGVGINLYNGTSSGWRTGVWDWVWVSSWGGGGYWDYRETTSSWTSGGGPGPPYSRWALLLDAVDAFLDVLDDTHQDEQVALGTFNSSGNLDLNLDMNFSNVRAEIASIRPTGGTSIGEGMEDTMPALLASDARPFAAKTIVVLTDGQNNSGEISPVSVAADIVATNNVTIHTVTFTAGADQATMASVASTGGGEHYHADDGSGLIAIFEEIANNLPTIITN